MARPEQKNGAASKMLAALPIEQTGLGFRVSRADMARMIGASRSYITELVGKGIIPIEKNGRIDPDRAVRELLRRQPNGGRLRFLIDVRREIDEANTRADQAQAAAAQATNSLADLRAHIVTVTRKLMESERRIDVLIEEIELMLDDARDEEVMDALGRAFDRAASSSDDALIEHLTDADEDLAALIIGLRPDLRRPPPTLRETIAELEVEQPTLLADLDEPPADIPRGPSDDD
ncbi:hypothetical protein [Allochromatium palmeri]|uniref:Uncharacterized protein n=1 Tax=Allochromatium palmeri TaxID=231048 RepID=A0A6N8EF05_9GAMM|nr:hypothetical protein [Allochromatium palmeri]MTW22803.1 hypothetical protein [Allochromatium palmeri]